MAELINTAQLLKFLSQGSDVPELEQFLVARRVHDRPKTVLQIKDEAGIQGSEAGIQGSGLSISHSS